MVDLKSQKGAITLIVLVSCMFFIASVVCIQMYTQSKQVAVDREYKQIKLNYEKDIDDIDTIYNELLEIENFAVTFGTPTINNNTISSTISFNIQDTNIKTLKYGWFYSENIINAQNIEDYLPDSWNFVEIVSGQNTINITKTYTEVSGYYYLCFMANNKLNYTIIDITQE